MGPRRPRRRVRRSKPEDPAALDEPACTRVALELLARREHSRRELTRKLAASKVNAVAYETIEMEDGSLPLLRPLPSRA